MEWILCVLAVIIAVSLVAVFFQYIIMLIGFVCGVIAIICFFNHAIVGGIIMLAVSALLFALLPGDFFDDVFDML